MLLHANHLRTALKIIIRHLKLSHDPYLTSLRTTEHLIDFLIDYLQSYVFSKSNGYTKT